MKKFERFYFENFDNRADIPIYDREEPDATSIIARVYNVEAAQKIVKALNTSDTKIGG